MLYKARDMIGRNSRPSGGAGNLATVQKQGGGSAWRAATWLALGWFGLAAAQSAETSRGAGGGGLSYAHDVQPKVPWSIHIIRVPRQKSVYQFHAAHAQKHALGLSPVSEQIQQLGAEPGLPVAAVNGDYYQRDGAYAGDPRGLQIMDGELLSAPAGTASFWVDAIGEPHATNTASRLQVTWPDGTTSPIGLNGPRPAAGIELYTPALGASTKTAKGRELVLERKENQPWLPLQASKSYPARVREIREAGDTPIAPGTMVLSIGPAAPATVPRPPVGAELILSTATWPALRGVKTALSGGPVLVANGKRVRIEASNSESYQVSSMMERHPRTAVGWNDDYFFLVTVDGRQKEVSAGMTLNELGTYLANLGCRDAINLDGGGSATLWCEGAVKNRPCDGFERPVANALVVLQKKK
jgi:hypothetical protein